MPVTTPPRTTVEAIGIVVQVAGEGDMGMTDGRAIQLEVEAAVVSCVQYPEAEGIRRQVDEREGRAVDDRRVLEGLRRDRRARQGEILRDRRRNHEGAVVPPAGIGVPSRVKDVLDRHILVGHPEVPTGHAEAVVGIVHPERVHRPRLSRWTGTQPGTASVAG